MSLSDPERPHFAHSSEEEFARILDYYGIEWMYEPRSFPLRWNKDGSVLEAFTPDFYLPEQDLYIELTTLRPELSTRKNRRLRMMKQLYPDVNVRLYKRGALRNLMIKYGLDQSAERIRGTRAQQRPLEQAQKNKK
ncbi:MAG: hypothetical protein M1132_07200 [Chloroflexi bacterium]|nr:hypothetical protein [Chloroflexota bacterium]